MTNRIKNISIFPARLDPTEADLSIAVFPEQFVLAETAIRGRLIGPKCVYASTVEVAHPLREQSLRYEGTTPYFTGRVIIPEPCLWDPISPFLYEGVIELWQGKECCEHRAITHGLRALGIAPRGLLWNRQPLTLRGTTQLPASEAEARTLHQSGCNALLLSGDIVADDVWKMGNRFGFLVLARLSRRDQVPPIPTDAFPCGLGWVVPWEIWREDNLMRSGALPLGLPLLGVELRQPPTEPLPKAVSFIACTAEALPALSGVDRPKLLLGRSWTAEEAAPPGILGWIAS